MLRPCVDHPSDFEPDPDPNADLYVKKTEIRTTINGGYTTFSD
jgi:hypothetical protein